MNTFHYHSTNSCGAPSSFLIQFSGTGSDSDNQYAVFAPYGTDGQTFSVEPTTSAGDATVFGVTNACAFGSQDLGFLADVSSNTAAAVFFDTPGNIRDGGYITPVCSVTGGIMSCDFQGATGFSLCPDGSNVSAQNRSWILLQGLILSSVVQPPFLAVNSQGNLPLDCTPVTLNVVSP